MLTAPTIAQIESIVHGRIRAALAERVGEVGDLSATEIGRASCRERVL